MKYAIAYTDKNGNGFNELPWIEGFFDTVFNAQTFINETPVLYNPCIFTLPDLITEQITWDYVHQHKII